MDIPIYNGQWVVSHEEMSTSNGLITIKSSIVCYDLIKTFKFLEFKGNGTQICYIDSQFRPVSGIIALATNTNRNIIDSANIMETGYVTIVGAFSNNTDVIINASYK